jgi:hypothetical protein
MTGFITEFLAGPEVAAFPVASITVLMSYKWHAGNDIFVNRILLFLPDENHHRVRSSRGALHCTRRSANVTPEVKIFL